MSGRRDRCGEERIGVGSRDKSGEERRGVGRRSGTCRTYSVPVSSYSFPLSMNPTVGSEEIFVQSNVY